MLGQPLARCLLCALYKRSRARQPEGSSDINQAEERNSRPFPSTRSGKREQEGAELSDRCSEWWRLQLPARRRWLRHGFLLAACCCSPWRPFTVSATARRTVQFFRVFSPVSFMWAVHLKLTYASLLPVRQRALDRQLTPGLQFRFVCLGLFVWDYNHSCYVSSFCFLQFMSSSFSKTCCLASFDVWQGRAGQGMVS